MFETLHTYTLVKEPGDRPARKKTLKKQREQPFFAERSKRKGANQQCLEAVCVYIPLRL